jgi:Xrn1 helical domain/XRN 5'-3' exonuclease N-terminus
VYYSGHDVPGEGEHKVVAFIRDLRALPDFSPNERFCMNGQDADMIMLAMATHEPFFHVLREVVEFASYGKKKKATKAAAAKPDASQPKLQYLRVNLLREYIINELSEGSDPRAIDKERLIDDFVFLTFLVGNDFLPHLPTLRIGDSAFDIIFDAYKTLLMARPGYIVNDGRIEDWRRLGDLFRIIGAQEQQIMASSHGGKKAKPKAGKEPYERAVMEAIAAGLVDEARRPLALASIDDTLPKDYRRRHYYEKFGILIDTEAGARGLKELVRSYLEGIMWCQAYYSRGCISWQWFFPYNFGPFLQDMTDLAAIASTIDFTLGEPFQPFQQLLGCLPPGSSNLLPPCYSQLMLDPESPLIEYYPEKFEIDMDGNTQLYQAVVLLPFIDASRLLATEEAYGCVAQLTAEELQRNTFGRTEVFLSDGTGTVEVFALPLNLAPGTPFKAALIPGTATSLPGFKTSLKNLDAGDIAHTTHGASKKGARHAVGGGGGKRAIPGPLVAAVKSSSIPTSTAARLALDEMSLGAMARLTHEIACAYPGFYPQRDRPFHVLVCSALHDTGATLDSLIDSVLPSIAEAFAPVPFLILPLAQVNKKNVVSIKLGDPTGNFIRLGKALSSQLPGCNSWYSDSPLNVAITIGLFVGPDPAGFAAWLNGQLAVIAPVGLPLWSPHIELSEEAKRPQSRFQLLAVPDAPAVRK